MNVRRPELDKALDAFAAQHGIVIGVPGGGKSHSLRQLLRDIDAAGGAAVPVPVAALVRADEPELRSLYGYPEEYFLSFLRRYGHGLERRVLVFDGFDAARDPALRGTVLALVRRCTAELDGWTVLVSVRSYEARHSADLLRLFAGQGAPTPYRNADLKCRHFLVPPLSDEEVSEATYAISSVPLTFRLGADLKELLRVPFNLTLLEAIANDQGDLGRVSDFDYQVELLREYWRLRIEGSPDYLASEDCLASLVRRMVEERSTALPRRYRPQSCTDDTVRRLHSEGVLAEPEPGGRTVAFGHNILFDFAVQQLLLDDRPRTLSEFIAQDETRALFLRPSFAHHFATLWAFDRPAFWRNYAALRQDPNPSVRFVGKLVPAATTAENARLPGDLEPLLAAEGGNPEAAANVLRAKGALGIQRSEVWLPFLLGLSKDARPEFVNELPRAVRAIFDAGGLSPDERRSVNQIGRTLLAWAVAQGPRAANNAEKFAATWAVPLILETFQDEPDSSASAIEPIVGAIGTPQMGIDLVYSLCQAVGSFWQASPDIAAELYRKVFANEETSGEQTVMMRGIMSFTSTRAQDYSMCRYALGESYARFLAEVPRYALPAGLAAVEACMGARTASYDLGSAGTASLAGKEIGLKHDYASLNWDPEHDDLGKIRSATAAWLKAADRSAGDASLACAAFADNVSYESAFGTLLQAAAERPDIYAQELYPFVAATDVIRSSTLAGAVARFFASSRDYLQEAQASSLKDAVFEALAGASSEREVRRYSLLISSLAASQDEPQETAEPSTGIALTTDWIDEGTVGLTTAFLQDEAEPSTLTASRREVRSFNDLYRNSAPDPQEALRLLAAARSLSSEIESLPRGDENAASAVDLARCLAAIARSSASLSDDDAAFLGSSLLAFVEEGRNIGSAAGRDHLGWTESPAIEAATGLASVYSKYPSETVTASVEKVIAGNSPVLRYHLANTSSPIARSDAPTFWRLLRASFADGFVESRQVALNQAWRFREEDGAEEFVRWATEQPSRGVRERPDALSSLVFHFVVRKDAVWAQRRATEALASLSPEAPNLIRAALGYVYPGVIADPSLSTYAQAARRWLLDAIRGTSAALGKVAVEEITEDDRRAKFKASYDLVDNVASHCYFRTSMNPQWNKEGGGPKDEADQRRMFDFVLPLLDAVSKFTIRETPYLVPRTAHHILQILNECLRYAPAECLRIAHQGVIAGVSSGYPSDPMAMREASGLVESMLADHRDVLVSADGSTQVRELLESFVNAGFPEAFQLAWRLDEPFR